MTQPRSPRSGPSRSAIRPATRCTFACRYGATAFAPDDGAENELMRRAFGGILEHLRGIVLYVAQTVNSYKRFEVASFAGLEANSIPASAASATSIAAVRDYRARKFPAEANDFRRSRLEAAGLPPRALRHLRALLDPGPALSPARVGAYY
jgi:hypothetical protein